MSETNTARISPLLRLLAEALEARGNQSQPQEGTALVEMGRLARLHIPVRGVLPLSDDQLFNAIDTIGTKYFDLAAVRQTLDVALARLEPSTRNEIEVAVDHLCALLNVVYFDAGLSFGVTLGDLRSL